MKITKTRLRQIIKEEIESIQEINNMPASENARPIPLSESIHDDDDDDDDFWGQERLSHEEREKFLAAFYTIEEAVKDGRLDNSVMDPVLHLLSCVGIYL
jgi:hypothetical protein